MKNSSEVKVEGTIKTVTFYNPDNGYTVLKMKTADASKPSLFNDESDILTATGYLMDPQKGETIILHGTYQTHPKFGRQLHFTSYEKSMTLSDEGLIDYLSSDLFPGVGEKSATRIIEVLGENALDMIRQNPAILNTIPGLSKAVITSLPEALNAHIDQEKIRVKLLSLGLTVGLIKILIKTYQAQTVDRVMQKPYDLMRDVKGIGFERADQIAMKVGFEKNHPERLRAMVAYLFEHLSMRQGHTHLAKEVLYQTVYERLEADELGLSFDDAVDICDQAVSFGWLVEDDDTYTLPLYQKAERTIANFVLEALKHPPQKEKALENLIEKHIKSIQMEYTSEQRIAIKEVFQHSIYLITGGPGTGKTTLIKSMMAIAKALDYDVAAVAPTGKAARRLEEATGEKATTIHRYLGIRPDGKPQFNHFSQATHDLIIIDEISMVDVVLMATLLDAMKEGAKVILVGDEDQLPSVAPGHVLADLKKTIPHRTLKEIHRQATTSPIITLAESFRQQTYQSPWQSAPELTMEKVQEEKALAYILKTVKPYYAHLQADVGILIPMYQGMVGIDAVNQYLQTHLNPSKLVTLYDHVRYKIGDKVIQLSNNYDTLIMNGEIGVITAIDPIKKTLQVEFDEALVTYDKETFKDLRLAYAISIHKSQGSGFDTVIMPLYKRFLHMLNRPLIYTAITRAKKHLVIIGDLELIPYALKRNTHQRHTKLTDKIRLKETEINEDVSPYDFL